MRLTKRFFREAARAGATAQAAAMTPEQRRARASHAAKARWAQKREALWPSNIDSIVQREIDRNDGVQAKRKESK